MIVVPKPTPVPFYHPASAPTTVRRDHTLPTLSFQSGRLARARPAAPLPVPLPIYAQPSPPPSPTKQSSRNTNTRRRKTPPRQPRAPIPSFTPSPSHSQSLSGLGLGGELELVVDYSDFARMTPPPLTPSPPPAYHRAATFPFAAPSHSPATTPITVPSARPPYTPTHSYRPSHVRSPSVPMFSSSSFPGHVSSPSISASFGERYANSGFQNSPPPRNLPKPSFLLSAKPTPDNEDPFL